MADPDQIIFLSNIFLTAIFSECRLIKISHRNANNTDSIKYPVNTRFFGFTKSDRKKSRRLILSIFGYQFGFGEGILSTLTITLDTSQFLHYLQNLTCLTVLVDHLIRHLHETLHQMYQPSFAVCSACVTDSQTMIFYGP